MNENGHERRDLANSESQGSETRLNVVLITLDAGRYDLLVENLDSLPNLRALAERSAWFENAFSAGPVTTFAFPAIIGGVYPYHWGAGIDQSVQAVDEVLKGSGYNTGFIIEWNPLLSQRFGYGVRADFQLCKFALAESGVPQPTGAEPTKDSREAGAWRFMERPYPLVGIVRKLRPLWERNQTARAVGGYGLSVSQFLRLYAKRTGPSVDKSRHDHHLFRQNLRGFINDRFESPQFLWVHTTVNHLPYVTPSSGSAFSARRANYLNARGVSKFVNYGVCQQLKRLYVESLKVADDLVGEILGALAARGLLDSSIIIVTSDHGEEFMEEGTFFHDVESSSDILLHVPLMLSGPRLVKARHIQVPVSSIDIPPTICDLLGVGVPESFRGISLKPILCETGRPDAGQHLRSRPLFSEGWVLKSTLDRIPGHKSHKRVFTVRKGSYKLKVTEVERGKGTIHERLELSDWISGRRLDPGSHREVVEELRHLVRQHVYEEGVVARNLKRKSERQHVKDALAKAKRRSPDADRKGV
ncbi:MAG: sulfatase-like hydrolase/transferase [Dehalococcoidia bacterium]|nr:sulfatase-like hydrolase/transferase [Dehalococcoidia bacterium]